jgi:flagellum-specific ATP synthase
VIPIEKINAGLDTVSLHLSFGVVEKVTKQLLVSKGPVCKIGDLCVVGKNEAPCEVIALEGHKVYLMPLYQLKGISVQDCVYVKQHIFTIPPIEKLMGCVINALGETEEKLEKKVEVDLERLPPKPLKRRRIKSVMPTGIKAIDSFLTIGEGQKIGIFAGTGVGKSTLLGMIARTAQADVNIIALIGERGREVLDFMERDLGEEGLKKSIIVVSTSDEQPLMNVKAAQLATSIAEMFRDQGKKVLLMMDSITRFAMARREIDVATGELPIMGKTPSMEPMMQQLLERSGMNQSGSITGIYTVLVENDDFQGVIPDIARGILDGHIVLSRALALLNHYPAIDVLASISRVMQDVVSKEHWKLSGESKKYMAIYKENEDEIKLDILKKGMDPEVDFARMLHPKIKQFLLQDIGEHVSYDDTLEQLKQIIES